VTFGKLAVWVIGAFDVALYVWIALTIYRGMVGWR
jgi:hypothetical protein